ncbi:MAG: DUF2334 domain-containing protein [Ignavibacteriaceae bacterium]|nr:DUF2334 domain-containing protein [Ignavibacteriaceae bacterium]
MMRYLFALYIFTQTLLPQDSLLFVIRVDDIYSRNVTYPAGILPFQHIVEQRGGKVTWAVMPHRLIEDMNLSGKLSAELRATIAAGHEISQHGYIHICQRCGQSSHEMFCTTQSYHFPYQNQMDLIRQGLEILRDSVGVVPVSFVPPGHQADSVTFQVLLDSSFQFISTTGPAKLNIYKNLYNLAPHNEYTWQITPEQYQSRLTSALADIRSKAQTDGYYCLLLHDPFIRPAYQDSIVLRWTGELLDSVNAEYGNKVRYRTVSQAAASFRGPLSSRKEEIAFAPENMLLLQSYPNPFNPVTTIHFRLIESGYTKLSIYNVAGEEIRVLLDENLPAGWHLQNFHAGDLTSGIYFVHLKQNRFNVYHKILLIK